MHGLILAGGLGSRLAADGVVEPKALVKVGGRPQLLRLCQTLEALGCVSVTCMVRSGISTAVLGDNPRRRVFSCATPSSLYTLALGIEAVPEGPVFCTMVDTIMPWNSWLSIWTACSSDLERGATAVLAVTLAPERDPSALLVRVDEENRVTAIGAAAGDASLATAGVYGFSPDSRTLVAPALARGVQRLRGFLAELASDVGGVRAVTIARALDLDRLQDLEEANAWAPMVAP